MHKKLACTAEALIRPKGHSAYFCLCLRVVSRNVPNLESGEDLQCPLLTNRGSLHISILVALKLFLFIGHSSEFQE